MLPKPNPELAVAHGLFSTAQAREAGYSSRDVTRQLRRNRWVRLTRLVLRDAGHEWGEGDDLLFACLAAGAGAVVGHRSAAQVYGWDLLRKPDRPELILNASPSVDSARFFRSGLTADEVVLDDTELLRVTVPARTAVDLACRLDLVEAVVAVDAAFRSGVLRPNEVEQAWLGRPGTRRHREGRRVLDLACALAGSVPETEFRLLVVLAGLPAPVPQYELVVDGELVGRFDFAWVLCRLLVEIDGRAYHSGAEAYQQDRSRSNASQIGGWLILRYTVDDVRLRPHMIVSQVREALMRPNSPRS